jgi:hypothetical protein
MLRLILIPYLTDHAHSLHVRIEIEPAVYLSGLVAFGFEGKDDFWIGIGLVESEVPEFNKFYLHRVANQLTCLLETDDRMVGGHIVENSIEITLAVEESFDIGSLIRSVGDGGVKFPALSRDQALKIHEILSKSSCFIEAAEADDTSRDDFGLLYAEDRLILQLLNGVDNSKGHADRQGGRDCDDDQI